MPFQSSIEKIIEYYKANFSFEFSITVEEGLSNMSFSYREDWGISSASLIKLFVFAELLRCASYEPDLWNQELEIDESKRVEGSGIIKYMILPRIFKIADLAEYMITFSDNIACNLIIDFLSSNKINEMAYRMGAKSTALNRKMMANEGKDNVTSSYDVNCFYKLLLENSLPNVSAYWTQIGQGVLLRSTSRDRLAKAFAPNCVAGTKSATGRTVIHDSGFFFIKDNVVNIVAMIINDDANFSDKDGINYKSAQHCFWEIGSAIRKEL